MAQKAELLEMASLRRLPRNIAVMALSLCLSSAALAQTSSSPHRTRLILKDGTYQIVLSYKVVGKVVRFASAERNGETEEIPLALVDLPATERWKADHAAETSAEDRPVVLSPELAREEAERSSRTPEVAPDLRLPDEVSILALDAFQGTPELVPLAQEGTDLNKETAHDVQKKDLNPLASAHLILQIPGAHSDVQLHLPGLVFYVRIGAEDAGDTGGSALTVDTHGAAGRATPSGGEQQSGYVIERLDIRKDARVVDSFRIAQLGTGKKQPDIIEMKQDDLPGGHWMKLTPVEPLEPGEYALIEVLNDHQVNLNVWDFGVNAKAAESLEAIRPEIKKPIELKSRH
jgi:hypothetical protein